VASSAHDATTVTSLPKQERRQHERFPQVFDIHARCLLSGQAASDPPKEFDGRIQNLSDGGACILSSFSLQPAVFVCCNFPVLDAPVSVPTLMQVRWTAKRGQKSPIYVIGFQFVVS
jgi:PilZ domain